ncbi:MAG TPA: acyl-CoA dehydrogenase family protein [Gemmatimonadaceae bacterium]|nr:acyl-CoA dehydrogenase family protein [Gemmatimonadaceae bacterium]
MSNPTATETPASFTRGLFARAIHDELVFPFPAPLDDRSPDEAKVIRRLTRDIAEMTAAGLIDAERSDAEETIREETIRAFAERGLLALTIPKQYGGLGLSATGYAHMLGVVAAADPSLGVLVGVHCGLGSKAIVLFGNETQKARYLPVLARGETLAAYALTEPETGSDAQNIRTTADLSGDGRFWLLNGRKIWIGNGQRAGVIATFAQTWVERRGERVRRPTAFIITPPAEGFSVLGTFRKLGIRGSTQAELEYSNLRVPVENVLGDVGKGFSVAVHVLNGGRHSLAAGCVAGTKGMLNMMTDYAEKRVQFGQPIANFEITQRKLSAAAAELYAADAMLGVLGRLADTPDADQSLEAACCKVFATDLLWRTADDLVQVAGGRGFVKPYPYERLLRDARINRIFEGTNEILRLFIALNGIAEPAQRLAGLGSALKSPLRNVGLLGGYAAEKLMQRFGATASLDASLDERLQKHKAKLEKHVGELATATEKAITAHRKAIIEKQMILERLANMAIDLFATACTISRTQRMIETNASDAGLVARSLALCDLFCLTAGLRFRENRIALESEAVDGQRRVVAAQVRERGGYAIPSAIAAGEGGAP